MVSETKESPTPWGLGEVGLGLVATLVCGIAAVLGYSYFAGSDRTTLPAIFFGLLGGWLGFFGTPFLVCRKMPGGLARQLGFRFVLPGDIGRGILVGICGQVLITAVYLPVQWLAPGLLDGLDGPAKELTGALSSWRWAVFSLFVGVISPICEEVFFRGFTLRALSSRWGSRVGIVASGVLFGLMHFQKIQTPALIAFGMLLAWRATKTKRIGETIIAHGTFNLLTVIGLLTGVS